ncbi:purine-nucleoside phosphorylase [Paenilisteria rocourtiae]|uniref:Purine nucleoside phosphorylase n=1 Tax=Listeria rocourtiae TaxID=647910 RepID=A0A4R6ZS01_9LIST|nr:purine-nucleoside phosphorylase [Listeria rocourtiae]EUJ45200.1 purine nucleoside phosphorylase [Listeria rocourtiae FSL F6-920]MBC1434678.1 purine-nucleoside phosphorylase [Listeria rocourtiae]MBC1603370.1 purine-nucleoside phosphorylase [Listeria rocourtiae]TDR55345.1 purine-nucleoside phosphorylase [Listeria rocourtiae]
MNYTKVMEAVKKIKETYSEKPRIGLILGSGLGVLADKIVAPTVIKYNDVPYFPVSTVEGHAGQFVFGKLENQEVVAMQGRFHFYEGYSMQDVTFPVRVMKELGVEILIVTNAAGGVNELFNAGDLMLISDHINFTGTSPLIGKNDDYFGPRFPDMSDAYRLDLREQARLLAQDLEIDVREGVYAGFTGPTYETPAEIRMMRTLGADAVGMSTVSEVIVANHCGLRCLGISCITNMAAGILDQPLSHEEVIETTEHVKETFLTYVKALVGNVK